MSNYEGYKPRMNVATQKYRKEHRSLITIDVSKEEKELWKGYAERRGLTLSGYIKKLIAEDNAE